MKAQDLDHIGVSQILGHHDFVFELFDLVLVVGILFVEHFEGESFFLTFSNDFPDLSCLAGADQPDELEGSNKISTG
jgi:hypothetical protein